MSDEETRNRRRTKLRNKHAKEMLENKAFRIKRVEPKRKLNERLTTQEWIKRVDKYKEEENLINSEYDFYEGYKDEDFD
jgi:hypothetical protein